MTEGGTLGRGRGRGTLEKFQSVIFRCAKCAPVFFDHPEKNGEKPWFYKYKHINFNKIRNICISLSVQGVQGVRLFAILSLS